MSYAAALRTSLRDPVILPDGGVTATGAPTAARTVSDRHRGQPQFLPPGFVLDHVNTAGPLSTCNYGTLHINAEAGMRILVHTGRLWVPHDGDRCTGVGTGESFVVRRNGEMTAMATRATQLELVWPGSAPFARRAH
jgi:hypothetical protein